MKMKIEINFSPKFKSSPIKIIDINFWGWPREEGRAWVSDWFKAGKVARPHCLSARLTSHMVPKHPLPIWLLIDPGAYIDHISKASVLPCPYTLPCKAGPFCIEHLFLNIDNSSSVSTVSRTHVYNVLMNIQI